MADQNIALGVQVPDAMKNISGMLNFANQAQQYQQGNVALQKEQIVLGERKAIQSLFQNPQAFTAPDGTTDYQKLINEGMKVAPTTFPTMVPQIIQAHKSSIEAQESLNKLTSNQRDQVGQFVMSLGSDTPDVARKKLDGLLQTNPQLKPAIDFAWKYSLEPAAANPQVWQQATLKVGQAAMAPGAQATAMTPAGPTVNTGQTTQQINTNPMAGPVGATVPGTAANIAVAPGALETIETDPLGNRFVVSRSPQGAILSSRPVPGSSMPGAGGQPAPSPGFTNLAPGQAQDIPIVTKERADINTAAATVPTQRFNNKQILDLSTTDLLNSTGTGAQRISSILGAVGVPAGSDYATNVQKLGHYLALQTQQNAKVMGANTDQSRDISEAASGSLKMTPDALKSVAKVNDAFATGLEKFNQGMEAAIRNAGGNILAARDFKNAWSSTFDPNVYRYANALQSGDKAEIDAILGSPGSAERQKRAKELAVKSQRLNSLSTEGR
jgi:hypothetical protein